MTTFLLILTALAALEVVSHHVQTGQVYLVLHSLNRC